MSSLLNSSYRSENPLYISKVVLIGNTGVGKTAVARRFVYKENTSSHYITVGVDFMIKEIDIETNNGKPETRCMRFHIWDTAGQERFRTITTMYYKEATAFILMFALDDMDSFLHIVDYWYPEIIRLGHPRSSIVLVGNKKDRYTSRSLIGDQRIQRWTEKNKIPYFETDINDMNSIQKLFLHIGTQIFNDATAYNGHLPGFKDENETFRRLNLKQSDDDDSEYIKSKNKKWYRICDCCIKNSDTNKDKWY
jgi:small GTP-binding protein